MKIGLITTMKYGLTQFIYRDIDALAEKGHEVRLFTLRNKPGLYNPKPEWEVNPVKRGKLIIDQFRYLLRNPIIYLSILFTALRTGSLVDMLMAVSFVDRMKDMDIMYAYFGDHKLFIGYYIKRMTGIPLVVTIRAYELYCNPNPKLFVEALAYCDRVVTITEFNKKQLTDNYEVPGEEIDIVRQIVNLEDFKNESKLKILIVGFFAEKKGHEILFKAIKQLNRKDIEVWVVGDINAAVVSVDCRKVAKELGIDHQVSFFGAQSGNALKSLYRESDIFCLPSRPDRYGDHEGFPNVIAEAMAFGKPIVSTRHAGIPEAIDTFLADENNVEQVAEGLQQACDSAELRAKMGKRNREVVEKMFSPANNDRLEEILKSYARNSTPLEGKPSKGIFKQVAEVG